MNQDIEAVRRGLQSAKVQLGSIHAISEALAALDHLTKANEELRAEVGELRAANSDNGELLTIAWMDGAHRSAKGVRQAIEERDATIDRLTKERDEARAEADPELLTIAWMDGSHRSAKAARDEIKHLTTRLSAMQEAIDKAVRTLRISQGRLALTGILEGVWDAISLLKPFATKSEPEVDPLVEAGTVKQHLTVEIVEYAKGKAGKHGDRVMIWVNQRRTDLGGYCIDGVPRDVAPVIVETLAARNHTEGRTDG